MTTRELEEAIAEAIDVHIGKMLARIERLEAALQLEQRLAALERRAHATDAEAPAFDPRSLRLASNR